jgi:sn-glycerol 3-phosphate transport system ATP-binding protein
MAGIVLRDVRKTYGRTEVVHGVNLDIAHGELVVILGPSGCGKSTLLRMVAGLEGITAGEIAIGGMVVNRLEPRERGCAMVFQNYALYPHMTVAENIGYSLKIAGLSKAQRKEKVASVAGSLGLTEFLDRKPGQLSGGQRQRVAMGRAMIREPKVFLYDEPLSNLDARLRVAMRVEIRKLHQRLGTTTLFVTHDQVEAMTLADRIVIMNKGVVEQVGTPAEVYGWPATTYVAGFLGSPGLNLIEGIAHPDKGTVRFADGQHLAYDRNRWPEVGHGPVIAGFRAETVQFGAGNLTAGIEFTEELGAAKLVHASFGGQMLVAHVTARQDLHAGSPFSFSVDQADVHLFDTDTGGRLVEDRRTVARRNSALGLVSA